MNVFSRFRYLALTALLLALLAGLLVWLNETEADAGAWRRVAEVARLVDEDTLTFIHIPDVNSAALAFQSTHFSEYGFDHTLAAGISHLAPSPPPLSIRNISPYLKDWQSLNVKDFTSTSTSTERLTFFQTEASDEDVRALIGKTWSPGSSTTEVFSELVRGIRYHHLRRGGTDIIMTHERHWHFIATDQPLLEQSLTRLETQTPIKSLSSEPRFEQTLISLPCSYEALAYLSHPPVNASGAEKLSFLGKFYQRQSRAIAITYTNENGLLREDLSLLPTHPPTGNPAISSTATAFQDQTLSLTSSHTLIYSAAPLGGHLFTNFLFRQFQNRWMAENSPSLHPIAANWENGFTGSWAIMLEPLKNPSSGQPSQNGSMAAILAFPLRNAEATQKALEKLSLTSGSGIHASDTQTYTMDTALLPLALVNLLDDIHLSVVSNMLLVSDQRDGITQVSQQRLSGPHLPERLDFQRLSGSLPEPSAGLLFIDSQNILRRSSEALRHPLVAATLWLGQRGQATPPFGLKPWQLASSSQGDILPTLAVWALTEDGYQQVALGTVSPVQWLLGVGAIMSSIDQTFLDSKPNIEEDSFNALPIEEELLDMIAP